MVSINYSAREVCCKIVYYGPGLSGKTTNLQYVHTKVPSTTRGDLISLATEADRTLYFDFLPINIGTINGFQAKFQLYTVPGQVYYNATRKLVLRGVDGLVFVADSQPDKMDENIEALANLIDNLKEYGYDISQLPLVIQYNKRDLPNIMTTEEMDQKLNTYNFPTFEASATVGTGVFDTLKLIIKLVLEKAKNSQVTIIEHYVSENDNIYFTNTVTEIVVEDNAIVDHYKLQEESKNAFHIARVEIDQERSSNFTSHSISTGGAITRNNINARFNGEGGECTLNGLFLLENKQLFDAHTLIDHASPLCNSHEHYKGILDDSSRGVFNGKVLVRQDAQKTNAFQKNNNILLSNNALVNTKPQLEIFADDVKCSHGATIGQIDEEAKFYLKSRGIGEKAANAILIHAFASDVIKSMKIESVRNYLEDILSKRFNQ